MKRIYLILFGLSALLFWNVFTLKADVLGPYIISEVPSTPSGYGRIVCPIAGANAPVTASITICDESGTQYTLEAHEPDSAPNCYFLAYGTYTVVGLGNCTTVSNWNTLFVGSVFTVSGDGYITMNYTGTIPAMRSVIWAPGTDDNVYPASKLYYATMKVYGMEANGSGTLIDSNGDEYGVFNYTGHLGGAHYFYIRPGTYTVKTIGTNGSYIYVDINGIKEYLSTGVSFTIPSTSCTASIVFSKEPF